MLAAFAAGVLHKGDFVQSRLGRCPFRPECLPRLQLEWRRRPFSCNRGWRNAPCGRNACRVCSWSAVECRFHAIAARRTPRRDGSRCMLRCDSLPRLQLECRRTPILCYRGWRTPLLAGMFAAFAAGVQQKGDFVQSRPEKRPFWLECLPRLQLECRRRPFSCNRGRENASYGRNVCRVCSWSGADGQFHAIAAGRTPLSAGMLATFAAGVAQKADFMQSRLEKRLFRPECLPRLQLECRRRAISCNRGREDAPFGRNACHVCSWSAAEGRFRAIAAGRTPRRDCSRCMLRCDSLPRLQLECRRRPVSCNRGWEDAPFGRNACRVCSWSAAEGRFCAIAAGKMPLLAGMLAAFAAGVPQNGDLCNRGPRNSSFRPNACRVCSWSAAEGRFCAIAAGKMPLLAGMLAAFAAGVPQNADFVQSRPGRCPFGPECLPRLQLECRRRPISCNCGQEDAPLGRNACHVCSWSAVEGQFCAIAAGKMPLLARMLATFAAGVPQNGDFVQSRPGRCPFWPECLPRLQLECRRRPILCNRGREDAPFGRNACRVCSWSGTEGRFHAIAAGKMPLLVGMLAAFAAGVAQKAVFVQSRPAKRSFRPAKRLPSARETKITPGDRRGNRSGCSSCGRSACGRCGRWRIR